MNCLLTKYGFFEDCKLAFTFVASVIIAIFLFFITYTNIENIRMYKESISNLHTLKDVIAQANQHIRHAAILNDKNKREVELEKRFITREKANNVYIFLKRQDFSSEDKKRVKHIIDTRAIYRDYQNKTVALIRTDKRKEMEESFIKYQELQESYYKAVDVLIESLYKKTDFSHKVISISILFLLLFWNVISVLLYVSYKTFKEHRSKLKIEKEFIK